MKCLVRVLAGAALMALFSLPLAARAEFSSACVETAQPLEILICNDAPLWDLDAKLNAVWPQALKKAGRQAEGLREDQRAWLRQRYAECQIPDKDNVGLSDEDRWRAAPCLVAMYYARLAALGFRQTRPPETQNRDNNYIHPLCFRDMVAREETPLKACNAGYRHVFAERDQQGYWVALTRTDGETERIDLLFVGRLYDQRGLYLLRRVRKPLGISTELYETRQTHGIVQARPYGDYYDGAQCHGLIVETKSMDGQNVRAERWVTPIEKAKTMDNGEYVWLERWVTPKSLIENLNPNLNDVGLADTPWSCVGRLGIYHHVRTGEAHIKYFIPEGATHLADQASNGQAQTCFERLFAREDQSQRWTLPNLKKFAEQVERQCFMR